MSTATLKPDERAAAVTPADEVDSRRAAAAETITAQYVACRVSFSWLGTHKGLSKVQKAAAALPFEADDSYLSASKKLIDTKNPKVRAVTAVRTRIKDTWESLTLPYVEPGVRLLRAEHVEAFDAAMVSLRNELADAVAALQDEYEALKREARRRLGSLYDPDDYPSDITEQIAVSWDFPSFEPPEYLSFLNPRIAAEMQEQFRARLEATVALAEAAFVEEFRKCIDHLVERLTGSDDGQPKVFRDSVVDNLKEFFERFKVLNLRSNPELDALVERAKSVVGDRDAEDLRGADRLRAEVASGLARVGAELDQLAVARPRRRIVLPGRGDGSGL